MKKKRIVITGLGIVAPNGIGKEEFWESNIKGISGIRRITSFDVSPFETKIGGEIKNNKIIEESLGEKLVKQTDRFAKLGIFAAKEAIKDARLDLSKEDKSRIAVYVGSGLGGLLFHEEHIQLTTKQGWEKCHPWTVPKVSPNSVSAHITIAFGITGPNAAISSACSSGCVAIGYAMDMIRLGRADMIISGGVEAPLSPFALASYGAMRVLSTQNDHPEKASRPFDKKRDGFVLSEGAAILVLEEMEHAKKRGAHIYAELAGYSSNSGAYHMVIPKPDAEDIVAVMKASLADAGIRPEDISYINAHGTSTLINDKVETMGIKKTFGKYAYDIPISSTKSMIGHSIGASGAIETAVCALAIKNSMIPPTINQEASDPECDLDYVPNKARQANVLYALCNSFGFGSNNFCLVLRRYDEKKGN